MAQRHLDPVRADSLAISTTAGISQTRVGYVPQGGKSMRLQYFVGDPADKYWWDMRIETAMHGIGHSIGLVHEHQRTGVSNIVNPISPAIVFAIERMPGYEEALRAVTAADVADVPEFRGLPPAFRLRVLSVTLLCKYWAGVQWVPITPQQINHYGWTHAGPLDERSIMLYDATSYDNLDPNTGYPIPRLSSCAERFESDTNITSHERPHQVMHSKLTRVLIALALVFFTSVALLGQRSLPDSALLTHRDIAHVEDLTDEHNETKRSISLYDAPHRALFEANPRYNSDAVATIWPSCSPYGGGARILPYCYVDEESETRLSWIVEQAIARWHEATDALNIDGEAPNAPIHLAIENMPGFDETMRDVAADYREPAFANLNPRQRMVRLFRDPDLAKKYWAPHWRRIMSWIPYTEDERRRAGLDISPQYDILSIMNHNGLHYIPGVGTARKGSTSMYNGAKLVPFATLGWYPPISPQNPTPPNDHLVWVGGNPNPGIAAISALDRARLHVLYPPSDLRHPMARTAPQNQSTGYTPAFRPVAVTMGTNTVTVRPAGPIPTGNDYFAAMGRMWQDLDKIYGLGMFGGPDTPGMVSTISNDSLLRGTGD
ncbi:hypothetical protein B0A48_00528 [Cryoendolithus antarcticus]|uniref:Uncharacterized protein n=1 Tax=Cryoendolithus antarcticus TaxID=1507870 RepID=A0A1V8TUZ3_9PEZI|nr:hypothetical protein B0A48_00528 [Cryoendolithus antarcticus]